MLRGRLQILPDGEEIDIGAAQVVHHLVDLLPALAEADHEAGLGEEGGVELLGALQEPQGGEVARPRTDRGIEARHGLEVVVVDVGPGRDHGLEGAVFTQEIGG